MIHFSHYKKLIHFFPLQKIDPFFPLQKIDPFFPITKNDLEGLKIFVKLRKIIFLKSVWLLFFSI